MPGASYPKGDAERRTRHQPAFGWVYLAPKPRVKLPPLPEGDWSATTRAWWRRIWSRPQAAMWDPSGVSWHTGVLVREALARGRGAVGPLAAELRQIEDRHGLNPKAMLQLRWRVADPGDLDDVTAGQPLAETSGMSAARRRRLLRQMNQAS